MDGNAYFSPLNDYIAEMERIKLDLRLFRISETDLSGMEQEMLVKARQMAVTAYAPYSGFGVGVAVLLDDGLIVGGNNQENAAYPSGLCAERVALFAIGANYPHRKIVKMMIAIHSEKKEKDRVYAPCGACRQVISESEFRQDSPISILFEGPSGFITVAESIRDLLPFTFELKP